MKRKYTKYEAGMTIKGIYLIDKIEGEFKHGSQVFRVKCKCGARFKTDSTKLRRNVNIQCELCRSERNRQQIKIANKNNPKHNKKASKKEA